MDSTVYMIRRRHFIFFLLVVFALMLNGCGGGDGGSSDGIDSAGFKPVGYEGSVPARQLSIAARSRMEDFGLQDLSDHDQGRYAILSDVGELSTWDLAELKARKVVTVKPYNRLRDSEEKYQSERVVFTDPTTGAMMMKLTNQPTGSGGDELIYYGKSAFSANGESMVWSRVDGIFKFGPGPQAIDDVYGPLVLNTDGTSPHIAFDKGTTMGPITSHPLIANRGYSVRNQNLLELDLITGNVIRTIATGWNNWHLKMSPDGNYIADAENGRSIVVQSLTSTDQWTIPLTSAIHDSYRFVPGDTDWIMFWYENRPTLNVTEFVNFKTGQSLTDNNFGFDWNHGDVGRYYGVHADGILFDWGAGGARAGMGSRANPIEGYYWPERAFVDDAPWYDRTVQQESYMAHWPDDQPWAYPTRIFDRPNLSEISAVHLKQFAAGGRHNRYRLCLTNLDWQNSNTQTLERPNISPDGTKLLFNSNVFGETEVYMVVAKKPEPPKGVTASWGSNGARIAWQAPTYHQEIAGYHVYRSEASGHGFVQISKTPVASTDYTDTTAPTGKALFYAVRSVEHSKLESELSAEVGVSSKSSTLANIPLRLYVEAEDALQATLDAPAPDGLWRNIDGLASNNHFIWQRRADKAGNVTTEVNIPRAAKYYVYARVKAAKNASTGNLYSNEIKFNVAGLDISRASATDWRWVRSTSSVSLAAGKQSIAIISDTRGSSLDAFYLSTDADFNPEGRVLAPQPNALELSGSMSAGYPILNWTQSSNPRFYYYNLYASNNADFEIDQSNLIASPDKTSYLDWQALAGQYYRVTQVTLDGFESDPSPAFKPN